MAAASNFLMKMAPYIEKAEIVGSIRRCKPQVNDVDIVILGKPPFAGADFLYGLSQLKKTGAIQFLGKEPKYDSKNIDLTFQGRQFNLYMAAKETFETLILIRTGSAEHNVRLCRLAQDNGWQLKASGQGLVDLETGKVIENTERGILERLLGHYVEPKDREVS